MVRPNFFIVGAAKSGTTSLYQYLTQHPQICMSSLKEPHFFGEYRPPGPEIRNMDTYLRLFEDCRGYEAVGEASTAYLYSSSAPEQIKTAFPNAKIIIVLRNPIDRAYSLYWNHVRDGAENLSFENALNAEDSRVEAGWEFGYHYVRSGMYSSQVGRYVKTFRRERVKVLFFDDLKNDSRQVLAECVRFLGVDEKFDFNLSAVHNRSGPPRSKLIWRLLNRSSPLRRMLLSPVPERFKNALKFKLRDINVGEVPPMSEAIRNRLIDAFSQDVRDLAPLVDKDLPAWMEKR